MEPQTRPLDDFGGNGYRFLSKQIHTRTSNDSNHLCIEGIFSHSVKKQYCILRKKLVLSLFVLKIASTFVESNASHVEPDMGLLERIVWRHGPSSGDDQRVITVACRTRVLGCPIDIDSGFVSVNLDDSFTV